MKLECGIVNESFKYQYGLFSTSPRIKESKDIEIFKEKSISITTGKRDWAAFQIMFGSDEEFMVTIGENPVFSPKDNFHVVRLNVYVEGMANEETQLCLVGFVEDDDRSMKADILLQDAAILVEKGRVQPVWVEVKIPADAKSGIYKGRIDVYSGYMFEDEKKVNSMGFDIIVKDVMMPAPKDYRFYLDLWQHSSNIARKHEVGLWSNEHFDILERYIKSLSELGQKAISVIASDIPWSGQGCFRVKNYPSDLFEYNIIKVEKSVSGELAFDFSNLERYINLCFKYGIDKEIEILGLICIWKYEAEGYGRVTVDYPDAIRIRYLDRKDDCYKYLKYKNGIGKYFKAIEEFFIHKGLIEKVRIVADEPLDKILYNEVLAFMRDITPSFKFKTAINHVDFIEESKGKIEDFILYLPAVSSAWDEITAIKSKIKGRLAWYVCCEPSYPNTFIASPLLEARFIGWLTAFLNFEGFLRWNYTAWPENPRERISYNYPLWFAGDTNFVYPANNGTPLLTLRYKSLKRGVEDFELIRMLEERFGNCKGILEKVWGLIFKVKDIKQFYCQGVDRTDLYSVEYADYAKAKEILLNALDGK